MKKTHKKIKMMSLEKIRSQINEIDDQIISLLEKRLKLAKETKKHKKKTCDLNRENEILNKINSKYIKDIYKTIFKNSKQIQKELI